jgi:hypothetical protein
MNKPEKLSLIVGGSIIGGLALGFAGYKWYKSKQEAKMDINALRNKSVGQIVGQITPENNKNNEVSDSALDFVDDDDDDVSETSLSESKNYGGKKKKSRRQKKNKSKNNRKRRSKKNKKSRK